MRKDLFFTALIFFFLSAPVAAQSGNAVVFYGCDSYRSAKAFVKSSIRQCQQSRYERSCLKKAKEYFDYCSFEGNYKKIYSHLHKDALMMFVLAGVSSNSKKK